MHPTRVQQPDGGSASTAEAYVVVHCAGQLSDGRACRTPLWRAYLDRLETRIRVRQGEHRTLSVPLSAAHVVSTTCERCHTVWRATLRGDEPVQVHPVAPYPVLTSPLARRLAGGRRPRPVSQKTAKSDNPRGAAAPRLPARQ